MKLTHAFPFDPTHGYTPEQLRALAPPPAPSGFDAFWQATYRETAGVPLDLQVKELESPVATHRLAEVRHRTLDGLAVGAWLVTPKDRPLRMAAVIGHGYGGPGAPTFPARDAVLLITCAPGFALSAQPGLPDQAMEHVVYGLAQRETYLIRHCVAALWSSAWVLRELVPAACAMLVYRGDSFGGGLGALMLPWEPLYRRGYLGVPTFGHQPLRARLACNGSGDAVQRYLVQHPDALEVLRHFDAATAATRIRIPVLCAPAHFDPAVAPAGQMAVANALRSTGEVFEISAGHFEHPGLAAELVELDRRTESFLWAEAPLRR